MFRLCLHKRWLQLECNCMPFLDHMRRSTSSVGMDVSDMLLGSDPADSQETRRHAFCKMPCEALMLKTSLAAGG